VERLPAVVYVADAGIGGRWHYVSPSAEAILGYPAEDWLADPDLWASRLHPEDREQVFAREAVAIAGSGGVSPEEYRLRHRDGRVVWLYDDAVLVADEQGRRRWHGVLTDITERKRAESELQRRAAQQAAVARLGERALRGADLATLMDGAVTEAARILQVQWGAVLALTPDRESLVLRAGHGCSREAIDKVRVPADGRTQMAATLQTGRAITVEDWSVETRYEPCPVLNPPHSHTGMTVLIEGRDGPWGILGVQSMVRRSFSASDEDFVQALANVLADAIHRSEIEDDIRHQALHDPLTGLPNRVLFLDRVEHALARRSTRVAVLFLDLDHFKLVNDSLGHEAGDALLVDVAPRLREAVRPGDTIGRFGGDEFGILLENVDGERAATEVAERIAAAFARPFVLDGVEHFAGASIGIALGGGGDDEPQALVRDADAAMYRAKERGRGRYELFDAAMRARAMDRLSLENDLRRALERDELRLAYQPVISLRDGAIVSVEALVRWAHPRRGLLPPGEFIGVAEESGLIEPLGEWVLDAACRQAARWHAERPDDRPVGVAVNLAARQLARADVVDVVSATLRRSGLEPSSLSLEITETVLLDEPDTIARTLIGLGALGVHVELDDFGTGYSSLGYLTRLPIEGLKLDRAFVDGLGTERRDTAVATAVVRMAQALSLHVTAEGVETEVQLAELIGLGCAYAQGFLFARPVDAADVSELLSGTPPWRSMLAAAR
jgi:diguanylate cyclase (GGDEF)-like protein/PAS domain S-box-containing protein